MGWLLALKRLATSECSDGDVNESRSLWRQASCRRHSLSSTLVRDGDLQSRNRRMH